jgi:hypothetical protein
MLLWAIFLYFFGFWQFLANVYSTRYCFVRLGVDLCKMLLENLIVQF